MSVPNLERRLAKIEASRRPPRGLYFVIWGCTAAEIEEAVSRARQTGHIVDGEPIVRCAWPAEYPMPAPRWAHDDSATIRAWRTQFMASVKASGSVQARKAAELRTLATGFRKSARESLEPSGRTVEVLISSRTARPAF
jgi:hypothetical protein